ncbi:unnamed protein product [Danaus chrysippus]|uniref:(African queen) hypothetical protein n=1 Tax=Danaus chrysippus TaxID=151541 RepID=A0A8J2R299_9NEOP|nr:unnamed protein product [Danaus chrysippus]
MEGPRSGGTAFMITVSPTPVSGTTVYTLALRTTFHNVYGGDGAYAVPTTKNYASELSTLGIITEVNPAAVQWRGLALGEPPS